MLFNDSDKSLLEFFWWLFAFLLFNNSNPGGGLLNSSLSLFSSEDKSEMPPSKRFSSNSTSFNLEFEHSLLFSSISSSSNSSSRLPSSNVKNVCSFISNALTSSLKQKKIVILLKN